MQQVATRYIFVACALQGKHDYLSVFTLSYLPISTGVYTIMSITDRVENMMKTPKPIFERLP